MNKLDLWLQLFDSVCLFNKGRSDTRSIDSLIKETDDLYDDVSKRFENYIVQELFTTGYSSPDIGYTSPGSTTITD